MRSEWAASKEAVVSSDHLGMCGRSCVARGENVSMNFIEDIDGQPINGHKALEIRKVIRELWVEMDLMKLAPKSWSKVTHTALVNFWQWMYDWFPKLAYCNGHWKLDKICTDNYSQWFRTHLNSQNENSNSNWSTSTSKWLPLEPELLLPSKKPKSAPRSRKNINGKHVQYKIPGLD